MIKDLVDCKEAAAFLAEPSQQAGLSSDEIRGRLHHLEYCPQCAKAIEAMDDPGALFERLAEDWQPDPQEAARIDALFRAQAEDEDDLIRAIEEALLPNLSDNLNKRYLQEELGPLRLFAALDTLRLLLHGWARRSGGLDPESLDRDGEIRCQQERVIPGATLVEALRRRVDTDEATAQRLLHWIFDSARLLPTLIPGVDAYPQGDVLSLHLVAYSPEDNLFERWRPTLWEAQLQA